MRATGQFVVAVEGTSASFVSNLKRMSSMTDQHVLWTADDHFFLCDRHFVCPESAVDSIMIEYKLLKWSVAENLRVTLVWLGISSLKSFFDKRLRSCSIVSEFLKVFKIANWSRERYLYRRQHIFWPHTSNRVALQIVRCCHFAVLACVRGRVLRLLFFWQPVCDVLDSISVNLCHTVDCSMIFRINKIKSHARTVEYK